jgi:hypothetical protein
MSTARKNSPSTREMERINWIEFREWVPREKIGTVLLPLGTLEPNGGARHRHYRAGGNGARDCFQYQCVGCGSVPLWIHWNHGC